MRRRLLAGAAFLALVSVAAWLASGGCSVDREIVKPVERRELSKDEILAKLRGSDFRAKLEAERQIDKLELAEKRRILLQLASEEDAAVRIIAAKHLRKLDDAEARAGLERLRQDTDPSVRDAAR